MDEFEDYLYKQGYVDKEGRLRKDLTPEEREAVLNFVGFKIWLKSLSAEEREEHLNRIAQRRQDKDFFKALSEAESIEDLLDL